MDYLVLNTVDTTVQATCWVNFSEPCGELICVIECPNATCGIYRVN